jgi:hypothetical protein
MADGEMTDGESIDLEKTYFEAKEEKQEEDENSGGWLSFSFGGNSASRGQEEEAEGDDEETEDTNDEEWGGKPRPADGEGMKQTDAVEGYGLPTKGLYEVEEKGYKTFGSTGQGDNTEGVKDVSDSVL